MKSVTKNKAFWYAAGLHFQCCNCGQCCSGPDEGYIWVNKQEVEAIADYLKITTEQLRRKYLKRVRLRTTIIEQPVSMDCIFLRKVGGQKTCVIYPVRPKQCRTWPFWSDNLKSPNTWNRTAQKCDGINHGRLYPFEEIEKIRKGN